MADAVNMQVCGQRWCVFDYVLNDVGLLHEVDVTDLMFVDACLSNLSGINVEDYFKLNINMLCLFIFKL